MPAPSTLADYAGWWFSLRCACHHQHLVPVRMLLADLRPTRPVAEVAGLLRCRAQCGERPSRVELVPDARCDHLGEPRGVAGKGPVVLRVMPPAGVRK